MNADALRRVIVRDLDTVRTELRAYPSEADIWARPPGITNPAGTLVLHLAGNLQHFIGAQLGGTGYVRDRDGEFSRRDVPRAELERVIEQTIAVVSATLHRLGAEELGREYPLEVGGVWVTTGMFLTHLATHLAYHLGQIDLHRRVVTRRAEGVGAQSIPALTRD